MLPIAVILGGFIFGVGAALAGGCTAGNGMVQNSLFSYQGWIALLFIGLVVAFATKIWLKPTTPAKKQPAFAVAPLGLSVPKGGLRNIAPETYALDILGAVCPFPLIDAKEAMNQLDSGEKLVIDFDCIQATETIPCWAADEGHDVADFHEVGDAG